MATIGNSDDSATSVVEADIDHDDNANPSGQISLPNYIVNESRNNCRILQSDVLEELNEVGYGSDSDDDGDAAEALNEAFAEAESDRSGIKSYTNGNEDIEAVSGDSVSNSVLLGGNNDEEEELNFPKPPSNWVDPEPNTNKNEPIFRSVDNPGKWSSFCFRATFKSAKQGGKYDYHALPTGCTPVPVSVGRDGKEERVQNGWKFYYEGWQPRDENNAQVFKHRNGANKYNLFPKERKGCLDAEVLKKLGMKKKVMDNKDCLFFYQLILPLCDTSKSGVENDPRMNYYCEVEWWSNLYALQLGLGGSYGH